MAKATNAGIKSINKKSINYSPTRSITIVTIVYALAMLVMFLDWFVWGKYNG